MGPEIEWIGKQIELFYSFNQVVEMSDRGLVETACTWAQYWV